MYLHLPIFFYFLTPFFSAQFPFFPLRLFYSNCAPLFSLSPFRWRAICICLTSFFLFFHPMFCRFPPFLSNLTLYPALFSSTFCLFRSFSSIFISPFFLSRHFLTADTLEPIFQLFFGRFLYGSYTHLSLLAVR